MTDSIKILIVDDHQMLIDGIKSLLRNERLLNIEHQALNGNEALEILKKNTVDIVITDISMPEMTGIELTKIIKSLYPEIKILVLSMYNDQETVNNILMAEAEGYILKNTGKKELVNALTKIANNGTFYSREVVDVMMENVKIEKKKEEVALILSKRELEIVSLICQEFSSEEIGEKLFISKRTVDTHRTNIIHKTKTRTIVGLIKFAIQNSIYKVEIKT